MRIEIPRVTISSGAPAFDWGDGGDGDLKGMVGDGRFEVMLELMSFCTGFDNSALIAAYSPDNQ